MKYRVKLKTTVTAWVEVELTDSLIGSSGETAEDLRDWAAEDAVDAHSGQLADRLDAASLDHGPIELAHEELDESVQVVT